MATINQRIPNFLGGVSQQPDSFKFPGQLRVCDNAVPDITFGLKKRPPGEFVKTLTNANDGGFWYEILRDGYEKYLVQITPGNTGSVPFRIWDLADGTEKTLTNSSGDSLYAYLSGATDKYSIQTIQDYTIITNPQKVVGTTGNTDAPIDSGNYAFAKLSTVAYNTEYVIYNTNTGLPTPDTYYRVTSLNVNVWRTAPGDSSPSWQGTSFVDGSDKNWAAGLAGFDFGVGDEVVSTANATNCEGITGHLVVNGTPFVESYDKVWSDGRTDDDGNDSDDSFVGHTQDYDHVFTATVTLKDGGIIKESNIDTAKSKYIDVTIEGQAWRIHVGGVEPVETYVNTANIGYYKTPENPSKGRASMSGILKGLTTSVNANVSNMTASIIGNGLYITGTEAKRLGFLGGSANEGMSVFSKSINTLGELPNECKHGYVVQVDNSADIESDNYYMKFIADDGVKGPGKWEETPRPHNFTGSDAVVKGLDPATMPHALVNNRNGTFTFKKLDETTAIADGTDNYWKYREVGDDDTNPIPSFNGKKIQKIFFYRNRLGLIADEQVVISRPSDYFNFFIVSAITTSDDNPIDISVSDIKPAFINHILPAATSLLLFSDNGQFMLYSDSDLFTPKTARLRKVSSYECDSSLQPLDLGTTTMFTSAVSAYTRVYESAIVEQNTPPQVIEQTRVVPEYVPKTVNISTVSAALGVASFAEKDSKSIYHYKYYNTSGNQRDQSAWYSWTLTNNLHHMVYTGGNFYTVEEASEDNFILNRYEYISDATAGRVYVLGGVAADVGNPLKTARWFEACLDQMVIPSAISFTAQGGHVTGPPFTDLTLPYTPTSADNFYAVALSGTDTEGNNIAGTVIKADSVNTNKATFEDVNMTGWTVACGYKYTTTIELPSYYLRIGEGQSDLNADLRISAINLEMGVSGPMEFHQSSIYADMDDFIQTESGMKLDESDFGKPPSKLMKSVRVPIQKKNDKYNLTIKVPDPFSTALISGSWDGIYNPRRHART